MDNKERKCVNLGPTARQVLAVTGMAFSCVLDGMVIAYSSPALPSLMEDDSSVKIDQHQASWIASVHTLGAVLGCLVSIPSMNSLGRRGATLYLMTLAYLVGFVLIMFAIRVEMIIAGRFIGGVGLGMTLSITPVYLVEVTTPQLRGWLAVAPPLLAQTGLAVTYLTGNWLDWRMLALAGAVTVVPFVLFVIWIPESPIYLASKGKLEETEDSLEKLGRGQDTINFFKDVNIDNVGDNVSLSQYIEPRVVKPFLVCLGIMFFFQATGFNTIIAYSSMLFRESGQTISQQLTSGIIGGVNLASTALALGLARLLPRKVLLIVSSIITALSLIILGSYFYVKDIFGDIVVTHWSWIPLTSMTMMIIFFMFGFGAVAWTVMAEILPARVRGNLYPFTVAFGWTVNFGFAQSFLYIQRGIGMHGVFWLYGGLTLVGTIFITFCVPETKNKNPWEVAKFFSKTEVRRSSSQETVVSSSLEDV